MKAVPRAAEPEIAAALVRCGQGDGAAFRQVYEAMSARLYGVALRITRNPALASDAVHDAMLQVWRNSDRYDPGRGNAEAWLVALVRYRALTIARRQGRETTGLTLPDQIDENRDALSSLLVESDTASLKACLEEVELPRRRLVLLAYVDGLTQRQIATLVGQPLGTVKSIIRRTLLALRGCLQRGAAEG